jgi:TetR/AcrR family transcriptional regulator
MTYLQERRTEEKERRRSAIVDAAEAVFADVGVEAARMEDVARKARVSRALLYLYFPDKIALHFSICTRALTLLADRFEQARARHSTGYEQVRGIGRAYLAFAQEFPHYFAALTRFEAHPQDQIAPDSVEAQCQAAGNAVHSISAAAVLQGIQDQSIRADIGNPHLVAVTLWGFLHGVIQVGQTKANMLARDGIAVPQLFQQAMAMCCASFVGPKAKP